MPSYLPPDRIQLSQSSFAMPPGDLLIEIALFLESRLDLLNLCLTSRYALSNVSSVLYESVALGSVEECRLTLGMLSRRFDIARHVRELVISPQAKYDSRLSSLDNVATSAFVRGIAASKCLDALVRFQWEADELPLNEDMWFALRAGCPQLRYIGVSLGSNLPSLNSHLFDFRNLSGFSLFLKAGFYEGHLDMFLDEDQPFFKRFSEMLIHRCPNLEELTIDGFSAVPADIHFLIEGRWPRLRKLSLGDVCIDWFPRFLNPGEQRPFIAFLEAHPNLEALDLSRHIIQPVHFATLNGETLNRVTTFRGTHQQLHALHHIHHTVKSVAFRDPIETREVSAPTVATVLRELPLLTTLKISFTLHSMYDSGNILRSLIQSCPRLRHLELTCGHKPSFQLDSFATTIRGFPKLRVLKLAIVKYPGDEIAAGAIRIARSNPRIQKFTLTFLPSVYPMSLPFSLPYLPSLIPFSSRASGSFEVTCDEHGLPVSLSGVETCRFILPWGLEFSSRRRKYTIDLRPLGYRERGQSGFRALIGLVCEKSAAGDEIRVILFCAFLAILAGCGIVANGESRTTALEA